MQIFRQRDLSKGLIPLVFLIVSLILIRDIYGISSFNLLGTEDAYSNLLYSETIAQTGQIENKFTMIEPRMADLPPLIPILVGTIVTLTHIDGKSIFLFLPWLLQLFSVILIYLILLKLTKKKYLSTFGAFLFIFNWRYIWVSSLSPADAFVIFSSLLVAYFYVMFWRTKNIFYFYFSFICVGALTFSHNFGNFLFAILFLSYFIGFLIYKDPLLKNKMQLFKITIIVVTVWFLYAYRAFLKMAAVYIPSVESSLKSTPTYLGASFLEILPEFYNEFILYFLIPLSFLFSVTRYKLKPEVMIFFLWLPLDIIMLAIIPESYSHRSRYPLQILVPLVIISTLAIQNLIATIGHRFIKITSLMVLVILLVLPVPTYIEKIDLWKTYVANSYGIREDMGKFIETNFPEEKVFYAYWPSSLYSYNELPNLLDYTITIQNSENPVDIALDENVGYYIYDTLSGYYYPFPDKAKDLLQSKLINLEIVKSFTTDAIVYKIVAENKIGKYSTDISNPKLKFYNFSNIVMYNISKDAHGLIKNQYIPYRNMTENKGTVVIPLSGSSLRTPVLYIATKITPNTKADVTIECNKESLGSILIDGQQLKGWEWWFEFNKVNLQPITSTCKEFKININKNRGGEVKLYKIEVFYEIE